MLRKISSALSQFPGLCRYFPRWGQGSYKASSIIRLRNALSLHKLIHSPHKHATSEHLKLLSKQTLWLLITHSKRRLIKKTHLYQLLLKDMGKGLVLPSHYKDTSAKEIPWLHHSFSIVKKKFIRFINKQHFSLSILSCDFYY